MGRTRANHAASAVLATVAGTTLAVGLLAALAPVSLATPVRHPSVGRVAAEG
jgi:hypothetical protein